MMEEDVKILNGKAYRIVDIENESSDQCSNDIDMQKYFSAGRDHSDEDDHEKNAVDDEDDDEFERDDDEPEGLGLELEDLIVPAKKAEPLLKVAAKVEEVKSMIIEIAAPKEEKVQVKDEFYSNNFWKLPDSSLSDKDMLDKLLKDFF